MNLTLLIPAAIFIAIGFGAGYQLGWGVGYRQANGEYRKRVDRLLNAARLSTPSNGKERR